MEKSSFEVYLFSKYLNQIYEVCHPFTDVLVPPSHPTSLRCAFLLCAITLIATQTGLRFPWGEAAVQSNAFAVCPCLGQREALITRVRRPGRQVGLWLSPSGPPEGRVSTDPSAQHSTDTDQPALQHAGARARPGHEEQEPDIGLDFPNRLFGSVSPSNH